MKMEMKTETEMEEEGEEEDNNAEGGGMRGGDWKGRRESVWELRH